MAEKGKEKKRERTKKEEPLGEQILRRIGSALALTVASVVTVVLGYLAGRYVIQALFADALGVPAAVQTAGAPQGDGALAAAQQAEPASRQPAAAASGTSGTPEAATASGAGGAPGPAAVTSTGAAPGAGSSSSSGGALGGNTPAAAVSSGPSSPGNGGSAAPSGRVLYRVQVGGYADRASAERLLQQLKGAYPDAFIVFGPDFRVQVGAFSSQAGAQEVVDALRANGYDDVHVVPLQQ